MNIDIAKDYSYLDQVRIEQGADECIFTFNKIASRDARRAVMLINDRRLMFPCLYILRKPIAALGIQRYLNMRNTLALRMTSQICADKANTVRELLSKRNEVVSVLRWMLQTGTQELLEDEYEEILDVTVSVLINTYGDRTILPQVVELVFSRNRNERYIHDLVWALFQAQDPKALRLIAQRVCSSEPKDVELALELLNMDQGYTYTGGNEERCAKYLRWLEENEPYLYFTQESFQYANRPAFAAVDLERKYLQKGIPSHDKQPIGATDEGSECLAAFKQLSAEEQKLLSAYSQKIHDQNVSTWKQWLYAPVSEQLQAAKGGWEGNE